MSQELQNQVQQLQSQLTVSKGEAFDLLNSKEKTIAQLDAGNRSLNELLTQVGEVLGLKVPELYTSGVLISKITETVAELESLKAKQEKSKGSKKTDT